MHVNQVSIVTIDFHHLVFIVAINIDVVVGTDMLVRQNARWLSKLVSWGIHLVEMQVAGLLFLINLEEEVFFSDNLIVGTLCKFLAGDLVFEFNKTNLLFNNFVNALTDSLEMLRASLVAKLSVSSWHGRELFQGVQVGGIRLYLRGGFLCLFVRVLPQGLNGICPQRGSSDGDLA